VCGDGIDNNCNDQIDENCAACTDGDEDGYFAEIDCGTPVDCNDNNPTINPGVTEVCSDGIDNNCDDNLDEGCGGVADTDGDGFYDQEELLGILLPPGLTITLPDGTTTNLLPPCGDSPADRSFCVDPTTKDLFVILVRATPSHLPQNPLEFVSRPTQEGGLGITVHELISTPDPSGEDPGRSISPNQKAVRVTEDLDTNGEVLGIANYGTPNQLDYAMVYTQRIINHIDSVCEGATTQCADASGISRPALYDLYIKHTIAHEIGHMLALTTDYNERFGGHHYASGSRIIMEQSVKYTSKQGGRNVTFYISTEYADPADIQGAALH
jgi:hypothetical protein